MSEPLLSVAGLHAHYGRAHVIFDVSLELARGEVVALMGRNGAGKSTTLKAIMGLLSQVQGHRQFDGRTLDGLPPYLIAKAGLGYVPEERRIFPELSVRENLEVGRQPPRDGVPSWTFERLFQLFPNLRGMGERPAGTLSGGEQQMLTIARTLMGNPRAILLDEPSEGLAPLIVEQMAATIKALKRDGLAVLLSEQNLYFAMELSDRAYVIEGGRIRYQGTMQELAGDDAVRKAYLTV